MTRQPTRRLCGIVGKRFFGKTGKLARTPNRQKGSTEVSLHYDYMAHPLGPGTIFQMPSLITFNITEAT